jgi:drug/metabolite transporter (DMT)-like permease
MSPVVLFTICTAAWGSTWLAIKYQLGVVAPEVSVAYRFALASALFFLWCVLTRRKLGFGARDHLLFAGQGALMFGLNYIAVYWAEVHLTSGLVAVLFATISFMSPVGMWMAFGERVAPRTLVGATLGVSGVALLFLPEILAARHGGTAAIGVAWALGSALLAMLGNLVSVAMHRRHLQILPSTAWGMFYGTLTTVAVALFGGAAWTFDARGPYVLSMLYLVLVGSVVAFGAYLSLLKQVGAGPSAYVSVSTPVVAMLLSTLVEDYRWTLLSVLGLALAAAGNVFALRGKRRKADSRPAG